MRTAHELEQWMIRWIAQTTGDGDVDPVLDFARLGLGSASLVEMLGDLERTLGRSIESAAAFRWPTPRAMAAGLAGEPVRSVTTGPVTGPTDEEPLAIIGIACRFPGGGTDPDAYWAMLAGGVDAVTDAPVARWGPAPDGDVVRRGAFLDDVAGFDAGFFGMSPREALRTDPQQRLLLELVWEGLEDAGTPAERLRGSRTGLVVGLMDTGQYGRVQVDAGHDLDADPDAALGTASSVAAGRVAHLFDLRGPALTVDTACSSSLVAVHLAAQGLRRGECDLVLAAGVSLSVHPGFHRQACAMSMLAADGRCKTFDRRADGFVLGEGGGVVVLERLSDARRAGRRIHAVLRGSAVNQDGHSTALTAPSTSAQVAVVRAAHAAAGVAPREVSFVETHGSGTRLGDAVELAALHEVFGADRPADRPLLLGAVKTAVGHTLAAAGMAGLIKSVLALRARIAPPNLHLEQTTDSLPADRSLRPVTARTALPGDVVGVSSFGWSGTNAHVVLARAPEASAADGPDDVSPAGLVLPLSAHGDAALAARAAQVADRLRDVADVADVARALGARGALPTRCAVAGDDRDEAIAALARVRGVNAVPGGPRVAFLLPGVGDQYRGMGRRLYATEPVFAATVDRCAGHLRHTDISAALHGPDEPDGTRTTIAHPLVVAVELALAATLADRGLRPDVVLGYSLGEYTAACLAGVFDEGDVMRLVEQRAALIDRCPAGAMLAVAADEEWTRSWLAAHGDRAGVAAVNGPAMTVVAGEPDAIGILAAVARRDGHPVIPLRTEHAFHSSLLSPVRGELATAVAGVRAAAPRLPVVSNLTGGLLTDDQARDPGYWAEHLCSPVRCADGLRGLADVDVFVEVGPGATLGALVRQNLTTGAPATVVPTLPVAPEDTDEQVTVRRALATTWERGADVRWDRVLPPGPRAELAPYPFRRTRFWPSAEPGGRAGRADDGPARPGGHTYRHRWTRRPPARGPLGDPGAVVVLGDPGGRGHALAGSLRRLGVDDVTVLDTPAAAPPARPAGRRATLVHLGVLGAPPPSETGVEHAARGAITAGVDELLRHAGSLGDDPEADLRLITVSAGALDVLGDDAVAPHRAAVHGFGRAVVAEVPRLHWSGVDLDGSADDDAVDVLARHLCGQGARPPLADVTAVRGGRCWSASWEQTALPAGATPWRSDGVYLITGGTRGLGMAVARHLARTGVRRLCLVARSVPGPDTARAPGTAGDRAERTRADVAALERGGVSVLTLAADASDPAALGAALDRAREHFGALHGVVHCAGVPGRGLAAGTSPEQAHRVLAPKVLGSAPLLERVARGTATERRLDLLVLFSSAVTVLGGLGESDYCAANTVLDAAAGWADVHPDSRVVSIPWGPWRHDDWQSDASPTAVAERVRRYRREHGISEDLGTALLDRIVAATDPVVLALGEPLDRTRAFWAGLDDAHPTVDESGAGGARFPRPALRTAAVAPRTESERRVARVWERFLGIDGVGVHDPFFDLGGNSLIGIAMVRALAGELATPIPPAVLFEHPTVADLAGWFDATSSAAPAPTAAASTTGGAARGARRRRTRQRTTP